ncbi:transposase [Microtetraspora niveoalba]|uniref:transposase n=1 Tax=Microtetraspora niveoalba TaxID=46175 RepID=UPI001FDF8728|nr:transposase [Microtetraspora niveoalba]
MGPDGYEIVPAIRDGRQVLQVCRDGTPVADCGSVEEVARHVDLADLCEVISLPARDDGRRAALS